MFFEGVVGRRGLAALWVSKGPMGEVYLWGQLARVDYAIGPHRIILGCAVHRNRLSGEGHEYQDLVRTLEVWN